LTRTRNKTRATTPPNAPPPHLKPHPTPILVSPLSTTSPDKGPTLRHPASPGSPSTHQTDRPKKKSTGKQNHPGYGTQYPHPGWHIFAPSHTLSDTHLHTHHLRPTRNNPPPAPGKPPTHRGRTPTRPRGQGKPTASNKAPKPPRTHTSMKPPNHPTIWRPHHLPQPPHLTTRTQHTKTTPPNPETLNTPQPTGRQARGSPATTKDQPRPVTPSQPPDTHHNQNPKATTNKPPPPCSPCQRQQPA